MNYASFHTETAQASKYISKLCRHFAHKVSATYTERDAQVRFPQGQCVMKARAQALEIYLQGEGPEKIEAMQYIIDDHLKRFARFESLSYQWEQTVPEAIRPEFCALTDTLRQP